MSSLSCVPDSSFDLPYSGPATILLDGMSLSPEHLLFIGWHSAIKVDLSAAAWLAVREGRSIIDSVLENKETVYGINTGFGNFASVKIPESELRDLQLNLIRSHAAGVGEPLSKSQTRMLLALRINVLAKGHSGIRELTVRQMLDALNANCLPRVPAKGTVGASGDLAPLSHLSLGLLGEGLMRHPVSDEFQPAAEVLKEFGLQPIELHAKEGLALINGTQLICSIGSEAIVRARLIARQADVVAALTVEALKGSARAFHPAIHNSRPHSGQILVAGRLRSLLNYAKAPSEITHSHIGCGKVQDSYTLRCIPQIHGIVHDTVQFAYGILHTECNSATDNPMIFSDLPADDVNSHLLIDPYTGETDTTSKHPMVPNRKKGIIISGGNFHGEAPAKALDYLTIGIHEIASVSERRTERLVNPHLSGLPAFLVNAGGLNSGFMMAHVTAAALVSENKVLCHPASIDSISTSAAQEDHTSQGGYAARKALEVVKNVEFVIAIELIAACQAIDLLRPLHTTPALEKVYEVVRTVVKPWDCDRYMSADIEAAVKLLQENKIWNAVKEFVDEPYKV